MEEPSSKAGECPPEPERLSPIVGLLLSGIANLKYAVTGKPASWNPAPSEKPPPIVGLLLSGIANLKYAITGKPEDDERR